MRTTHCQEVTGLAFRPAAWQVWLACAVVLSAVHIAPLGDVKAVGIFGLTAGSMVALWRHRDSEGRRRSAWRWVGAGVTCSLISNIYYIVYWLDHGTLALPPSPADLFALAHLALVGVGITRLMPRRAFKGRSVDALDALIGTVATAVLVYVWTLDSFVHDDTRSVAARVLLLVYPAADLGLLYLLARRLDVARHRNLSERLLLGALVGLLCSDIAYTLQLGQGTYVAGGWADIGWLAWFGLIGVAVLHPSAANAGELRVEPARTPTRARMAVATLLWAALAATAVSGTARHDLDSFLIVIAGMSVMFVLCLVRLYRVGQQVQYRMDELGMLAAHELQTPTTVMLGTLDTLERRPDLPDTLRAELVTLAARQARRLAQVATDLAALARIELNGGANKTIAVADVLELATLELDPAVRRRVHITMDGAVQAHADFERLQHALRNLLATALSRGDGESDVELSAEVAGGRVYVRVREAVACHASADLLHSALPQQSRGLSAGATVADSLVRSMGGNLRLARGRDGRSEATITLPAA